MDKFTKEEIKLMIEDYGQLVNIDNIYRNARRGAGSSKTLFKTEDIRLGLFNKLKKLKK